MSSKSNVKIKIFSVPVMNSMRKIELDIVALSHSVAQTNNYAVVLGETEGSRRLPIVIGGFEAQAIAVAMERMLPNRPLTHDLFKNIFDNFNIKLTEVVINNLADGIFYAQLICQRNGTTEEIDSRTSDALALAVRFECPIYTYEFILDAAGVIMEDSPTQEGVKENQQRSKRKNQLTTYSPEELQSMLEEVLSAEDYKKAAAIRDEIKRRQA